MLSILPDSNSSGIKPGTVQSAIDVLACRQGPPARTIPLAPGLCAQYGSAIPNTLDRLRRSPTEAINHELQAAVGRLDADHRLLLLVPDSWGAYRRLLLHQLLGPHVTTQGETEFLLGSGGAVSEQGRDADRFGVLVRVGSEVTTATLVAREGDPWAVQQQVETEWGGDDLDDALLTFVRERLPSADQTSIRALRRECTTARIRLSTDVHTDIAGVRVHRADLDQLARADLEDALRVTLTPLIDELPETVGRVWLSGGLGAMPLAAQLASEIAGLPVRRLDWATSARSLLAPAQDAGAAREADSVPAAILEMRPATAGRPRRRGAYGGLVAAAVTAIALGAGVLVQPAGTGSVFGFLLGDQATAPLQQALPRLPGQPPAAQAATRPPKPAGLPSRRAAADQGSRLGDTRANVLANAAGLPLAAPPPAPANANAPAPPANATAPNAAAAASQAAPAPGAAAAPAPAATEAAKPAPASTGTTKPAPAPTGTVAPAPTTDPTTQPPVADPTTQAPVEPAPTSDAPIAPAAIPPPADPPPPVEHPSSDAGQTEPGTATPDAAEAAAPAVETPNPEAEEVPARAESPTPSPSPTPTPSAP